MDMGGMSGMSGMGGSNSSMMTGMMGMGFMSGPGTPLFSPNWTPMSTGAYAGTCIFLLALGSLLRVLLATKAFFEHRWANAERDRRIIVVRGKNDHDVQEAPRGTLVAGSSQSEVRILKPITGLAPWRLSTDMPRAVLVTVIAGVGYLLMLAVMTYNVGYFFSILAGIFVGELAIGRYGGGSSG